MDTLKCSVHIATSAEGYIATPDGGVDWLHSAGDLDADMGINQDMGFNEFIRSVDCMIMGRKCMEMISSFNLSAEQWPYGDIRIFALSHKVNEAPDNLKHHVEMYSGDIRKLVYKLSAEGFKHAYIDGGSTITSFLNSKLIDELVITKAPVLLGNGIPLFGKIEQQIKLKNAKSSVFPNNFIQIKYQVAY